ncbi:MAG: hypothetical protein K6G42_00345 [Lachnospiraceae bacterium]|nr:hypothetical protein [Lachnospiraceae bacterium]
MSDFREFIAKIKDDYDYGTYIATFRSLFITILFTIYNGILGSIHSSVWYVSICLYYSLLILLRFSITFIEHLAKKNQDLSEAFRRNSFIILSVFLIILNICLIGPFALMVKQESPVNMTLIPAIAMAAYTFYKLTMSGIHFKKSRQSQDVLIRLARLINLIDALFSIVVLQTTLIMVASGSSNMFPVAALSSAMIWVFIMILSIRNMVVELRR